MPNAGAWARWFHTMGLRKSLVSRCEPFQAAKELSCSSVQNHSTWMGSYSLSNGSVGTSPLLVYLKCCQVRFPETQRPFSFSWTGRIVSSSFEVCGISPELIFSTALA